MLRDGNLGRAKSVSPTDQFAIFCGNFAICTVGVTFNKKAFIFSGGHFFIPLLLRAAALQ